MQILNNDYWNSYLKPYVADLGVALAFGVGCLLFKTFKKDDSNLTKSIKESIKKTLTKWNTATSLQKFHSLIINNTDKSVDAYKILKSMSEAEISPEVSTYNCLIYMSFDLEHYEIAYKLYEEISDFTFPIQPDVVTFNILLKGLIKEIRDNDLPVSQTKELADKYLEKINKYKSEIEKRRIKFDDFTFNTLIDAYVECGALNQALNTYEDMKNYSSDTEKQFKLTEEKEITKVLKPDIYTYTTLIKGLKIDPNQEENLTKILDIYENIKTGKIEGIKVDEYLVNSVLDACVRFNKQEKAISIFGELSELNIKPSVITYSILLKTYAASGNLEKATELFNKMKLEEVKPNEVIYDCLLNCAIKTQRLDMMKEIYDSMIKDKITPNGIIYSTLVKGFNRTKNYNMAFQLYENMSTQQLEKVDIVFFNALLDCCVEGNNPNKMIELYSFIKQKSEASKDLFQPTVVTYSTLLKGYTKFNLHHEAQALYNQTISNSNIYVDEVFFNTMADYWAKIKDADKVLEILQKMKERKVIKSSVIYSILIKLYSTLGNEDSAIKAYDEMKKEGLKPTLITYTAVMQMFIKNKKMDYAINVFYEMRSNDIAIDAVTYNFIINGCSFNKKLEKAIEILEISFKDNIKLHENTYNNVLEYLVANKFMRNNERCHLAGQILKNLKERNISLKYEVYSKVMKMMYQSNSSQAVKEIENYTKFSSLKSENTRDNYAKKENDYKQSYSKNESVYAENTYTTSTYNGNKSSYNNNNNNSNITSTQQQEVKKTGFNRSGNYKNYNQF